MDEIERLKKLAGLYDNPYATNGSMGENLSYTGTAKAEYERKHKIKRGSGRMVQTMVRKTQPDG